MQNSKLPTVTVGIPAYNAERNIARLLKEVLAQREEGFVLSEILVHVDLGMDQTAQVAKSVNDSRIRVIEANQRQGFAGSFKRLLSESTGEIFIQLNDDVVVASVNFLADFVKQFSENSAVGLSFAQVVPICPKSFTERVSHIAWSAWNRTKLAINNGKSAHTIEGKGIGLSRKFISKLDLDSYAVLGNLDITLYFKCIEYGFVYSFSPGAAVWFKHLGSWEEYHSWNERNACEAVLAKERFGAMVDTEYQQPRFAYVKGFVSAALLDPLAGFVFILDSIMRRVIPHSSKLLTNHWSSLNSTKNI